MKALVIGYGSIGQRHARLLKDLGHEVSIVSKREIAEKPSFATVKDALSASKFDYAVIANPTGDHFGSFSDLASAGFSGKVLVEKPVFESVKPLPKNSFSAVYVGYNLRFKPVVESLAAKLAGEKALTANFYVGQYLPDWRRSVDYRQSYSAHRAQGGGVLRDLSHELDLAQYLFGKQSALSSAGGHVSALEIDSDDAFAILMKTERCPIVVVQVSYLDRVARREIVINTDKHHFVANLIANTLTVDGKIETFESQVDDSYAAMHKAILSGSASSACTLESGLEVLKTVERAERNTI